MNKHPQTQAYLDPGSGSYLFQIVIGVFLGALVSLKIYWKKILHSIAQLLGKRRPKNDAEALVDNTKHK